MMVGGAAMELNQWLGGGVIDIGNPSGPWIAHLQSSSARPGCCWLSAGQIGRVRRHDD
jgi:hypothetical protein